MSHSRNTNKKNDNKTKKLKLVDLLLACIRGETNNIENKNNIKKENKDIKIIENKDIKIEGNDKLKIFREICENKIKDQNNTVLINIFEQLSKVNDPIFLEVFADELLTQIDDKKLKFDISSEFYTQLTNLFTHAPFCKKLKVLIPDKNKRIEFHNICRDELKSQVGIKAIEKIFFELMAYLVECLKQSKVNSTDKYLDYYFKCFAETAFIYCKQKSIKINKKLLEEFIKVYFLLFRVVSSTKHLSKSIPILKELIEHLQYQTELGNADFNLNDFIAEVFYEFRIAEKILLINMIWNDTPVETLNNFTDFFKFLRLAYVNHNQKNNPSVSVEIDEGPKNDKNNTLTLDKEIHFYEISFIIKYVNCLDRYFADISESIPLRKKCISEMNKYKLTQDYIDFLRQNNKYMPIQFRFDKNTMLYLTEYHSSLELMTVSENQINESIDKLPIDLEYYKQEEHNFKFNHLDLMLRFITPIFNNCHLILDKKIDIPPELLKDRIEDNLKKWETSQHDILLFGLDIRDLDPQFLDYCSSYVSFKNKEDTNCVKFLYDILLSTLYLDNYIAFYHIFDKFVMNNDKAKHVNVLLYQALEGTYHMLANKNKTAHDFHMLYESFAKTNILFAMIRMKDFYYMHQFKTFDLVTKEGKEKYKNISKELSDYIKSFTQKPEIILSNEQAAMYFSHIEFLILSFISRSMAHLQDISGIFENIEDIFKIETEKAKLLFQEFQNVSNSFEIYKDFCSQVIYEKNVEGTNLVEWHSTVSEQLQDILNDMLRYVNQELQPIINNIKPVKPEQPQSKKMVPVKQNIDVNIKTEKHLPSSDKPKKKNKDKSQSNKISQNNKNKDQKQDSNDNTVNTKKDNISKDQKKEPKIEPKIEPKKELTPKKINPSKPLNQVNVPKEKQNIPSQEKQVFEQKNEGPKQEQNSHVQESVPKKKKKKTKVKLENKVKIKFFNLKQDVISNKQKKNPKNSDVKNNQNAHLPIGWGGDEIKIENNIINTVVNENNKPQIENKIDLLSPHSKYRHKIYTDDEIEQTLKSPYKVMPVPDFLEFLVVIDGFLKDVKKTTLLSVGSLPYGLIRGEVKSLEDVKDIDTVCCVSSRDQFFVDIYNTLYKTNADTNDLTKLKPSDPPSTEKIPPRLEGIMMGCYKLSFQRSKHRDQLITMKAYFGRVERSEYRDQPCFIPIRELCSVDLFCKPLPWPFITEEINNTEAINNDFFERDYTRGSWYLKIEGKNMKFFASNPGVIYDTLYGILTLNLSCRLHADAQEEFQYITKGLLSNPLLIMRGIKYYCRGVYDDEVSKLFINLPKEFMVKWYERFLEEQGGEVMKELFTNNIHAFLRGLDRYNILDIIFPLYKTLRNEIKQKISEIKADNFIDKVIAFCNVMENTDAKQQMLVACANIFKLEGPQTNVISSALDISQYHHKQHIIVRPSLNTVSIFKNRIKNSVNVARYIPSNNNNNNK